MVVAPKWTAVNQSRTLLRFRAAGARIMFDRDEAIDLAPFARNAGLTPREFVTELQKDPLFVKHIHVPAYDVVEAPSPAKVEMLKGPQPSDGVPGIEINPIEELAKRDAMLVQTMQEQVQLEQTQEVEAAERVAQTGMSTLEPGLREEVSASLPSTKWTKQQLLEYALERGLNVTEDSSKNQILRRIRGL